MGNYSHREVLESMDHEGGVSPAVMSRELTAPPAATFFLSSFDPGFNGTIVDMEYSLGATLASTDLGIPTLFSGTCADDATVGTEAWINPTNAQGSDGSAATIDFATGGTEFTGTAADDASVGTIAWTNITNAQGDTSGTYASATLAVETTHYAKCTNFGFALDSDATILGIKVEFSVGGTTSVNTSSLRLVKGGSISGDDKAGDAGDTNWNGAAHAGTSGDATELWGLSWTAADINASTFGVAISAVAAGSGDARLYTMKITIYAELDGHYLKCTNYSNSLPSDATIVGIVVDAVTTNSDTTITDNSIKIVKGGSISGDDQAGAVTWDGGAMSWGGATELWGLAWTAADINASTFGVAISATGGAGLPTAEIRSVSITIYYTMPVLVEWIITPQSFDAEVMISETLTWVAGQDIPDTFLEGFLVTTDFSNANAPFTAKMALTWVDGTFTIQSSITDSQCVIKAMGVVE